MALDDQMNMFEENDDMGLMQEGGDVDPVSGNEVPLGGTQEGVRDDVEANVSEGEMVIPEDVVRYHGVEHFMQLRDEAKMGYKKMEAMGQMGNPDEASIPDEAMFNPGGLPFSVVDMEIEDTLEEQPAARYGGMPMHEQMPQQQMPMQQQMQQMPMQQNVPSYQAGGYVGGHGIYPSQYISQYIPNLESPPHHIPEIHRLPAEPYTTYNIDPRTGQPMAYRLAESPYQQQQRTWSDGPLQYAPAPGSDPVVVSAPAITYGAETTLGLNRGQTGSVTPPATIATTPGTTAPTKYSKLPSFNVATGGVSDSHHYINKEGNVIVIPVQLGQELYPPPEGYKRYDPTDRSKDPTFDEEDDKKPEEETEQEGPRELTEAEKARAGLPPYDAGAQEGPDDVDSGEFISLTAWGRALDQAMKGQRGWETGKGAYENPLSHEQAMEQGMAIADVTAQTQTEETAFGLTDTDDAENDTSVADDLGQPGSSVSPDAAGETSGTTGTVGDTSDTGGTAGTTEGAPDQGGDIGMTGGESAGDGNGNGDAGGDGPGASHICTATYNAGLITTPHFKSLKKYGIDLRRNDPYLMKAYDMFGPILAQYVYKNKNAKYMAKFLTKYYKDSFNNKPLSVKQKIFKIISNYILRPTYRTIGWISVKL